MGVTLQEIVFEGVCVVVVVVVVLFCFIFVRGLIF